MKQLNVKYIIKRERWVINASRIGDSDKLGSYLTEAEARKDKIQVYHYLRFEMH